MTYRVLTAQFMHETNTFSRVPTDIESYRRYLLIRDNEIPEKLQGTRTAFGATFEAAAKYGWSLIHPIAANANPSGIIVDACFDAIAQPILDAARQQAPIHGVLLHLHGAMVIASSEDGEGELLKRLRHVIGPDVPVVVTLDLHANVTEDMCRYANSLISYRTYPHIDGYERAHQGAALLQRAMKGDVKPACLVSRRAMLRGLDGGRTQGGPMVELLQRADKLEACGDALVISIQAGFSAADIEDVGPSIAVTVDLKRDPQRRRGQAIADEFIDYAWQTRDYRSHIPIPVADGVRKAKAGEGADRPLILADITDNPGGGNYGDSTNLLKAMIAADLKRAAFHAINDPEAVKQGLAIGIGNRGRIRLGGKIDPTMGGAPLDLDGQVTVLHHGRYVAWGPMGGGVEKNHGLTMVFRVGGIDIVATSNNAQATDLAQMTSFGIDPTRCWTLAVKSSHHFRAAYQPISREVITVDSGSLGSERAKEGKYQRARRPIWPIDAEARP
jgi:microcystin degradation protein MlrC